MNTSWYKVHGHQVLKGLLGVVAFFSKQAKNTSNPLPKFGPFILWMLLYRF
jgi:hypothetical protein